MIKVLMSEEEDDMDPENDELERKKEDMAISNNVVEADIAGHNLALANVVSPADQILVDRQLELHGEVNRCVEKDQHSQVLKSV